MSNSEKHLNGKSLARLNPVTIGAKVTYAIKGEQFGEGLWSLSLMEYLPFQKTTQDFQNTFLETGKQLGGPHKLHVE